MKDQKMPLNKSMIWILVSILLISGTAFMGWLYFLQMRDKRLNDEQYRVVAIMQSSQQVESLKTGYLAELLDLSLDRPLNLYSFSIKEAEKKLESSSLIKKGTVKKILPGTLYIDYEMRTPCALLGDYSNTALDKEGVLFPFKPFFTPKHLPVLYLGVGKEQWSWGNCLVNHPKMDLAFDILAVFDRMNRDTFSIKKLDLSYSQSDSYGQRQIVLLLEENDGDNIHQTGKNLYLRLGLDHYEQNLINFFTLYRECPVKTKNALLSGHLVIDFRIPHLAFIKEI